MDALRVLPGKVKPGHLIRRNHQRAVALFAEEMHELDITPMQYQVLASLHENPGIDQISLSALAAIDKSTIADLLKRMEDRKLIKRERGEVDQRTKILLLTPTGDKLLKRLEPMVERVQNRILEPLEPKERAMLQRLLAKMVAE